MLGDSKNHVVSRFPMRRSAVSGACFAMALLGGGGSGGGGGGDTGCPGDSPCGKRFQCGSAGEVEFRPQAGGCVAVPGNVTYGCDGTLTYQGDRKGEWSIDHASG